MAEAAIQFLLENVASLIKEEAGLIGGVDKEMKKLQSTLTTIQSVLEDAELKRFESKQIRDWLTKLNNVAYEIEDILDEYATEVSKRKHTCCIFNFLKISFHRDIGTRMKDMNETLVAVAAERTFHLEEKDVPQSSEFKASRETISSLKESDHIYGREDDKEKIVDILVNKVAECQQLSVLPIIGLGGLGKTTLAQLVFNDKRVSQHFGSKLWVCVSDNFDLKFLVKAMIESATGKASNLESLEALQRQLCEVLNQKRYLLILDDVWNLKQESWDNLERILACGSKGASVVVTTRLKTVADIMRTLPAYDLKGLSEEHCWLLFKLRAFGRENEELPNLETIGREIVKKCVGVPLAAKALGGLLRYKRTENEWIHVKNSEIWNLPEEETHILPALRLSYHHLPLVLRRCFVYCAVFQKDFKIEKHDLIFRWMAHGCISSNGTQEVEDVGDKIWNELVLRSFFQEVDTSGIKTTFKMHDLVHDLALSVMENNIPGVETKSNITSALDAKIREVYFEWYNGEPSLPSIAIVVPTLTTIRNYNRLRILKLRFATIEKLPSAIGKLKHLRYLDLTGSDIHSLPHTFCGLWNLQILILDHCGSLESLPKHIRHMTNLRHIFLEGCFSLSHMPSGVGELTSLKTLSLFIVGREIGRQLDELEHLNLGGRLKIKHLERAQNLLNVKKANLVEKPNLRYLGLNWEDDSKFESAKMMDEKVLEALEPHQNLETLKIDGFRGSYLSVWMTKLQNVTTMEITNCPNCSHLPPLRDLPRLKSLYLRNIAALEYIHVEDEIRGQNSVLANFRSLEKLRLCNLSNLKGLSKEEVGEMFPNLHKLDIKDCKLLIMPPLSSLVDLDVRYSSLSTLSLFSYKLENLSSLRLAFGENDTICIPEDAVGGLYNLKELEILGPGKHLCLPEKWLRSLKSLKELSIRLCHIGSNFLEGGLQHLIALEELIIVTCWEVVELPEEIKYLHLLKRVRLWGLDEMVSLPQVLQHIPSLQSLELIFLELTSLPEWLGNLTSLTHLEIVCCPKLASLPSSIQGMTILSLQIRCCPQLERRCEKEKGEDWQKIAHIPQLDIR